MGISYAFASDVVALAAPNAYTQRVGPKKFANVEKTVGLEKLVFLRYAFRLLPSARLQATGAPWAL